jgi:ribosomal protein L21E
MYAIGDRVRIKTEAHFKFFTGKTGVVVEIHDDGEALPIEVQLDELTNFFGADSIAFDEEELEHIDE